MMFTWFQLTYIIAIPHFLKKKTLFNPLKKSNLLWAFKNFILQLKLKENINQKWWTQIISSPFAPKTKWFSLYTRNFLARGLRAVRWPGLKEEGHVLSWYSGCSPVSAVTLHCRSRYICLHVKFNKPTSLRNCNRMHLWLHKKMKILKMLNNVL